MFTLHHIPDLPPSSNKLRQSARRKQSHSWLSPVNLGCTVWYGGSIKCEQGRGLGWGHGEGKSKQTSTTRACRGRERAEQGKLEITAKDKTEDNVDLWTEQEESQHVVDR